MRFTAGLVAAVVAPLIVWAAPPASAASALVVTPASGLADGSTVSVTGTGFPASTSIAVVQCKSGAVSELDCDLTHLTFAGSDSHGAMSTPFVVKSSLTTAHGPVVCTASPGACSISAASPSDIAGTAASVPLSFTAPGPPQRGTIALSSSDFYVNTGAHVIGDAWAASAPMSVLLCSADATTTSECTRASFAVASPGGHVDGYTQAYDFYVDDNGRGVDCTEAPGCAFGLADTRDPNGTFVLAPFGFATPKDGTLTANPTTGLHGGDNIRLHGTGWLPIDVITVEICTTDDALCIWMDSTAVPNANGAFTTHVQVPQWLDGDHICGWAGTQCELRWGNALFPEPTNHIPLQFAAPAPIGHGTISAPSSALASDSLTVSLAGWAPETFVRVAQCATGDTDPTARCRAYFELPTDVHGSATLDYFYVVGSLTLADGDQECTDPGSCAIVAWDPRDPAGSAAVSPLTVQPFVVGSLAVTPASGLHEGDTVTLHGEGWSPNEVAVVAECADATGIPACRYLGYPTTGPDGSLDTTVKVTASLLASFWPYDCTEAVGRCHIEVHLSRDFVKVAEVDLGFVPNGLDIVSHYTGAEAATVHAAATELGLDDATYQRTATWATMWVLGIAHVPSLGTVPTDTGAQSITSTYPPFEASFVQTVAARYGLPAEQFQKHAALALAFVLGLS